MKKKIAPQASLIVENRSEPKEESAGIESCAMELIIAIHLKDPKAVAQALQNAYDVLDSKEDSSAEPHSYEAQNIKAGDNY